MPRTLYHLHINHSDTDHYYGSILSMIEHHSRDTLGVAKDTLYKHDWKAAPFYRNDRVIIKRGILHTTDTVRALRMKAPAKKRK